MAMNVVQNTFFLIIYFGKIPSHGINGPKVILYIYYNRYTHIFVYV